MKNTKHNGSRFSSLRTGLRQLGYAALATLPMLGSVQAATDEFVYFHTDALGSPTAAFSEAGEVCWVETYSPYGEKQVNDDNAPPWDGCGLIDTSDVAYTGHVQDSSGLVYAQQRYYDPVIGRFMSTDPTMPHAGDPRYFGRYHYGANNPYKYTDPSGEWFGFDDVFTGPVDEIVVIGGLTIGAYLGIPGAQEGLESLTDLLGGMLSESSEEENNSLGNNPDIVAEEYDSLEAAVGSVNELDDVEYEGPTKAPGLVEQGFTEKHSGVDSDGVIQSAFKNPKTGRWTGGHESSKNDKYW